MKPNRRTFLKDGALLLAGARAALAVPFVSEAPIANTADASCGAEMGGERYQQATFLNGTPYTFQSNPRVADGD